MFKSLQLKLAVFLLIPTALILAGVGFTGFIFARDAILNEWREVAILKLQRAAHQIDMRLEEPLDFIKMFYLTGDSPDAYALQEQILERLNELEGVKNVRLEFFEQDGVALPPSMSGMGPGRRMAGRRMMRFHQARFVEVTPPHHDVNAGYETVSLISSFKDSGGRDVGKLDVELRFDHLLRDIRTLGWWQSDIAGLVDESGAYLAHTEAVHEEGHQRLGEDGEAVETAMLAAMKKNHYGTVLGKGHPPERVGGFYRLELAPWTLVLFAPGESILAPILRFRFYYALAGLFTITAVLVLMRWIGGKLVRSIKEIADAADAVSSGTYGPPLQVASRDEVGLLRERFNSMVAGLKEKDFITNTFGRYMDPEIARELLNRPGATRLGGEKREVVVLISDIRGFTHAMEPLDPESVIRILNIYYTHMLEAIRTHRGIVVDFFGDGVLVFFDPLEDPVAPVLHRALCCALKMQAAMVPFNQAMMSGELPGLEMGIGVNVGEVVVGNIGSEARTKYGIVGTAVNITQRIQAEAKGGQILLSESAYAPIKDKVTVSGSFHRRLKGINEDVRLHVLQRVLDCRDVSGKGPEKEIVW